MSALRVLQLATAGPLYGAERWVMALARAFDPAQVICDVGVIDDLGGDEPPLLTAARSAGLGGRAIPCRGRFDRQAVKALRRLLVEGGYDVVHTHGYKADALALLAARGTKVRTVATPHGWSEKADWKLRLYERADRWSFGLFDAVAPLSPDLCADVRRNPFVRRKLTYIPNGVDLDEVDAARAAGDEVRSGPFTVGYCGQLIARKDVATLLRAFARWGHPDARIVLVGDGDARDALQLAAERLGIADRVQAAGYRSDRLDWITRFDLFVLPSFREGIPRVLMEAMALGVPVVASDIPGNRDIVTVETGQLFAPGDVGALVACLDAARRRTPEEAERQVAAARALIETRHSARAMAVAYEGLFRNLMREPEPVTRARLTPSARR